MRAAVRDQNVTVRDGESLFDVLRVLEADSVEVLIDRGLTAPHVRTGDSQPVSIADAAGVDRLRRLFHDQGVRICAFLLATDFSGDSAEADRAWAAHVVRAAADLNVPAVRIDPFTPRRELDAETVRKNVIRAVRRLLEETADTGVAPAMENHGPIANDESFLDAVLSEIPDPRFGLTLDTGNFYWYGYPLADVYRLIGKYAPRARHTHLKNIAFPPETAETRRPIGHEYKERCCGVDEGNLDLRRVITLLRDGGYRGDLCIEDESLFKIPESGRPAALARQVRAVRRAAEI